MTTLGAGLYQTASRKPTVVILEKPTMKSTRLFRFLGLFPWMKVKQHAMLLVWKIRWGLVHKLILEVSFREATNTRSILIHYESRKCQSIASANPKLLLPCRSRLVP